MLIALSTYGAEDMRCLISEVYRKDPLLAPTKPEADVNLFTGTNMQKLYDIHFDYGQYSDDLRGAKNRLNELEPFSSEELTDKTDREKTLTAFEYLKSNCKPCAEGTNRSVYSALIDGRADSEGNALAYVVLCGRLGVECSIVYGQLPLENHCRNIVCIDGECYHVDVSRAEDDNGEQYFMCSDERFREEYRWDVASYPVCKGWAAVNLRL